MAQSTNDLGRRRQRSNKERSKLLSFLHAPEARWRIVENCNLLFDRLAYDPDQDWNRYAKQLGDVFETVQSAIVLPHDEHRLTSTFDLCHFQYRSLIAETLGSGEQTSASVRRVFPLEAKHDQLADFTRAVQTYEEGKDILPQVKCAFCSILFSPQSQPDENLLEKGVYPIRPAAVKLLADTLVPGSTPAEQITDSAAMKFALRPWNLSDHKRLIAFEAFREIQGTISSHWQQVHKHHKGILAKEREVFDLALDAAIGTMQLASNEVYDFHQRRCGTLDQARNGRHNGDLNKLRRDVLEGLGASRDHLPQRVLTFFPIRMKAHEDPHETKTIGLVVFYSSKPIFLDDALALAMVERLAFLVCRQYEFFAVERTVNQHVKQLEMRRVFAQMITHEASKPLDMLKQSYKLMENAAEESTKLLGKLIHGEFANLGTEREFDLSTVSRAIRSLYAPMMDQLRVSCEDRIEPDTNVMANWDVIRLILGVLLNNAVVHSGEYRNGKLHPGTGKVELRTDIQQLANADFCVVSVANNGQPMPPRLEQAITAGNPPARSLSEATDTAQHGVGLSLAYELARLKDLRLEYQRRDDDPRGLLHVFKLRIPKASPETKNEEA